MTISKVTVRESKIMISIGKSASGKYWNVKYKEQVIETCTTKKVAAETARMVALALVKMGK